mgnify:CR=1 FL=1
MLAPNDVRQDPFCAIGILEKPRRHVNTILAPGIIAPAIQEGKIFLVRPILPPVTGDRNIPASIAVGGVRFKGLPQRNLRDRKFLRFGKIVDQFGDILGGGVFVE